MSTANVDRRTTPPRCIVSDAGPIISLEKLTNGFSFIRLLYDCILIPPAVLGEVGHGHDRAEDYLSGHGIADITEVREPASRTRVPDEERLHKGEIQAIRLALELNLPLLIEEAAGRRSARASGLVISGVAGQIVKGYRRKIITIGEARSMLGEMVKHRRINERIYEHLISGLERSA